ncbi:MAG: cytidylate kinase-like family protein [Bacteroidaceae bacterium]|nr:cytidylate kinase-like family protein [Bacteroidaceae bacterium]
MKYVISIGRQLGSGGKEIAEKLGRKLNITVYDKKLLEMAAKESGLDTTVFEKADEKESDSFFGSVMAFRNSIADAISGYGSCMQSDKLFEIQSEAMRKIAGEESCITIGRCAEYVLREHPNLISIFVTADMPNRIRRIMKNNNLNEEKAKEFIAKADKERKAYHDYYATTIWGDSKSYDLCINSSRLGIDETVEYIYGYVKRRLAL